MKAVFVVLAIAALVVAQPTVPSPSPSTSIPATASVTASVTPSITVSVSVSPSANTLTATATVTPSVSVSSSPYTNNLACFQNTCTGTGRGTCQFGALCCSGVCRLQSSYGVLAIGATCDTTTCSAQCDASAGLSCISGTCAVAGKGFSCTSNSCAADGDCVSGLSCLASLKCGYAGIYAGGYCDTNTATCASPLTCVSNVCTAVPNAGTCTVGVTINGLSGGCISTNYCNAGTCATKIATGTACTTSVSCVSGLCNSGFCAEVNSVQSQGACSATGSWGAGSACATGLFCSGQACEPQVGTGGRCQSNFVGTGVDYNYWCLSGICSYGKCLAKLGAPGDACLYDSECASTSSNGCLFAPGMGAGTAGICSGSTIGQPCAVTNGTACGRTPGLVSCTCSTNSATVGTFSCQAPAATTATCTVPASTTWTSVGYPSLYALLALGTAAQAQTAAAYICCASCTGSTVTTNGINYAAALSARGLDCTAMAVGSAFNDATNVIRCTNNQNTAIAGSTVFGVCKSTTTGAASSVLPTVALLVAIVVASVAALF